jgi:hypothetical protein
MIHRHGPLPPQMAPTMGEASCRGEGVILTSRRIVHNNTNHKQVVVLPFLEKTPKCCFLKKFLKEML